MGPGTQKSVPCFLYCSWPNFRLLQMEGDKVTPDSLHAAPSPPARKSSEW